MRARVALAFFGSAILLVVLGSLVGLLRTDDALGVAGLAVLSIVVAAAFKPLVGRSSYR